MTRDDFEAVMSRDIKAEYPEQDRLLAGLNLIAKYLPKSGIEGADHDIIFACSVDDVVAAGITEEDALQLNAWNWFIESESGEFIAHFV